jgi:hypothetical protein
MEAVPGNAVTVDPVRLSVTTVPLIVPELDVVVIGMLRIVSPAPEGYNRQSKY